MLKSHCSTASLFLSLATLSLGASATVSRVSFAQGQSGTDTPVVVAGSKIDPDVVPFVDVEKYAGLWYEIASIPQSFQGFCQFTTAEYAVIAPGQISVANKCRVGFVPVSIYGTATVVDVDTNAILEVTFDNVSRKGDYRIVDLADDYSFALVSNAKRDALFVLARGYTLDDATYTRLLDRAAAIGVDTAKVRKTKQN